MDPVVDAGGADWHVLHTPTPNSAYWSSANLAEAAPGVLTPLGWGLWQQAGELSIRWGFHALGALERRRTGFPADPDERCIAVFYGRAAIKIDFFCEMGARIPGTGGRAIAEQYLGRVPEGLAFAPQRRRYPMILTRMPALFLRVPRRIRAHAERTDTWWRRELATIAAADADTARRSVATGARRFVRSVCFAAEAALAGAQPVYDQVVQLAQEAGRPELGGLVLAGHGSHVETRLVEDLWALSRGQLNLATYLDRHGYHGPLEGEVSSRVWREDPSPVRELSRRYRNRPEAESPTRVAQQRAEAGRRAEEELLAALPRRRRAQARVVLRLARGYLPLRGIAKIPFLQSLDVTRAAARRLGQLLVEAGQLDRPDDAFFLTLDELTGPPANDWRDRVAARTAEREAYQHIRLPQNWRGMPDVASESVTPVATGRQAAVVTGIPASPGVVEGTVRVLLEPDFGDIDDDEILVAPTTDPSWASIMFVSKALVVDIGGTLSHAAVVAREMGIPCVMGTSNGTTALRTGDHCRVDGTTGEIVVLKPAAE